jgi:hypothetical protein
LEDRTLPAVGLRFDPAAGALYLRSGAGDHTVRQALDPAGFVEVSLDGRLHSSDPASAAFDPALAGATAGTLAGIRLDGGGQDTLTLGSQQLAGSLTVATDAPVLTEDVTVAGRLAIQAPTITVGGALRARGITLDGTDNVTVEAGGLLAAGRIDVSAGAFVNSGQLHADGPAGGAVFVTAANVLNAGRLSADGGAGGDGGAVRITFTGAYLDTASAVTSADGGAAGHGGWLTIWHHGPPFQQWQPPDDGVGRRRGRSAGPRGGARRGRRGRLGRCGRRLGAGRRRLPRAQPRRGQRPDSHRDRGHDAPGRCPGQGRRRPGGRLGGPGHAVRRHGVGAGRSGRRRRRLP